MKTYSEKLKDPRWQRKRLEIMERDGFACKDCGDDKSMLSVHHCLYIKNREPWDYEDNELRTLCESCHEQRHLIEHDIVLQFKRLLALVDHATIISLFYQINGMIQCGNTDDFENGIEIMSSSRSEYFQDIRWWLEAGDDPKFRPAYERVTDTAPNWEHFDKMNQNQP